MIPGVTDVHPALAAFDAQPIRMHGPSPTQGLASGAVVAAVAGGPAGLVALGGIVAVAAVEYLGSRNPDGSGPLDLESVGKLSGAAKMALARMDRESEVAARDAGAGPDPGAEDEARSDPNSPPA